VIQDLFLRTYGGVGPGGEIQSALRPTGIVPQCLPQLREHGVELPSAVADAIERRRAAEQGQR
jgi:pilus assembly protein CpaF